MRLAFLGSPSAARPTLAALVGAGHEVTIVVTGPDRRRGRGGAVSPTPVKELATTLGLAVSSDLGDVTRGDPELGVVVAFGRIIPATILARLPMVNVHFSLLPRWRGAAPVERCVLAGDARTGVCLMALEETLDTGPVYARASTAVDDKSAAALTAELAALGADLVVRGIASGLTDPAPQTGPSTYAAKIRPDERVLVPDASVAHLARVVRVGGASCVIDGRRVRVESASARDRVGEPGTVGVVDGAVLLFARDGALALDTVTPAGATPMAAAAWWRGRRPTDPARWSGREITPP